MANKYRFDRDCITVNGKTFPARYAVDVDGDRGGYVVRIWATVDGGEHLIEVPAADRQHKAALKAAQMGLTLEAALEAAQEIQQAADAPEAAQEVQQNTAAPEAAQDEKEAQTMKSNNKRYAVYFSDYPRQAMTVEAANKRDAEKAGRAYIKAWNLAAKIDRVERVEGDAAPVEAREVQQATAAPEVAQEVQRAEAAPEVAQGVQQATAAPEVAQEVQQNTAEINNGEDETMLNRDSMAAEAVKAAAAAEVQEMTTAEAVDPKATRGPVPEKTFKNTVITGDGWSIVFDAGCNRTRVIISEPVKALARPIVEAAGFYYSKSFDSWNKKLTFRAFRAANALAEKLRAALA